MYHLLNIESSERQAAATRVPVFQGTISSTDGSFTSDVFSSSSWLSHRPALLLPSDPRLDSRLRPPSPWALAQHQKLKSVWWTGPVVCVWVLFSCVWTGVGAWGTAWSPPKPNLPPPNMSALPRCASLYSSAARWRAADWLPMPMKMRDNETCQSSPLLSAGESERGAPRRRAASEEADFDHSCIQNRSGK